MRLLHKAKNARCASVSNGERKLIAEYCWPNLSSIPSLSPIRYDSSNFATVSVCNIESRNTREISKTFKKFSVEAMSSTLVLNTRKNMDEGIKPSRSRDLSDFPYLIRRAGSERLPVTGCTLPETCAKVYAKT